MDNGDTSFPSLYNMFSGTNEPAQIPFEFIKGYLAIMHKDGCTACAQFSWHLHSAFLAGDESFFKAKSELVNHVITTSVNSSELDTLRATIAAKDNEIQQLRSDLRDVEFELGRASTELDQARRELDRNTRKRYRFRSRSPVKHRSWSDDNSSDESAPPKPKKVKIHSKAETPAVQHAVESVKPLLARIDVDIDTEMADPYSFAAVAAITSQAEAKESSSSKIPQPKEPLKWELKGEALKNAKCNITLGLPVLLGKLDTGKLQVPGGDDPTSIEGVEKLFAEANTPGNDHALGHARAFMRRCQNVTAETRTPAISHALRVWRNPTPAKADKGKQRLKDSATETPAKPTTSIAKSDAKPTTSTAKSDAKLTTSKPTTSNAKSDAKLTTSKPTTSNAKSDAKLTTSKPTTSTAKSDAKQKPVAKATGTPSLDATAEQLMIWNHQQTHSKYIGVPHSLAIADYHTLEVQRRLGPTTAAMTASTAPRSTWTRNFIALITIPRYYERLLMYYGQNVLPVISWIHYPFDMANMTPDNVARHLAECGITIRDVDSFQTYGMRWILSQQERGMLEDNDLLMRYWRIAQRIAEPGDELPQPAALWETVISESQDSDSTAQPNRSAEETSTSVSTTDMIPISSIVEISQPNRSEMNMTVDPADLQLNRSGPEVQYSSMQEPDAQ